MVHHVVEDAGGFAGGMNRDDPGVAQPGDHPGLGQESLDDAPMHREVGVHDLHGDGAVERGVGGQEHGAHAPAPQFPLEAVLSPQGRLQPAGEAVRVHGHTAAPEVVAR